MDVCKDKILMEGLKKGSYEDFVKLYSLYSDLLYGFCFKLLKSPSEAKDIVQESFLRIWQNHENINVNLSFKSYLYTISKNLIADSFRKKINNVDFKDFISSEAFYEYSDNNVENDLNFEEFQCLLKSAKNKLTKRQREVFELRREKGYSISQISQLLDISEKSVKNQLSLTLSILKAELSGYYLLLLLISFKFP